jgi:predicted transcriptional regulator
MIIQNILEEIVHADINNMLVKTGIVKSHLIKNCGLKVSTAEKYLKKMENAGYITSSKESWGERSKEIYKITRKGEERYKWFVMINAEME